MAAKTSKILLWLCLCSSFAVADELWMKNGSHLVGTLISASDSAVVFNTPFAGEVTVKQEHILSLVTSEPVTLMMDDDSVYREKQIVEKGGELLVLDGKRQPVEIAIADIKFVNPDPWRLGDGYTWRGQANATIESERGNSDTDELDVDLESVWRSLEDRYTVRGLWEIDRTQGDKTKNTWWLRNKYDRFFEEDLDNYWGYQIYFEHDEFADLDIRTLTGPYLGRQFFDNKILTMHAEVGVVYVDERFDVAEDSDFWGSNWEVRLTSGVIPRLELYLDQAGVLNLNETSDMIINTTAGIRFPILFGFQTAAEVKWEYDGGAVDDVDTMDETYNFKIGYSW